MLGGRPWRWQLIALVLALPACGSQPLSVDRCQGVVCGEGRVCVEGRCVNRQDAAVDSGHDEGVVDASPDRGPVDGSPDVAPVADAAIGPCDPGATLYAGSCWHTSDVGASCTAACASHGGYSDATRQVAGDLGTEAACGAIVIALGFDYVYIYSSETTTSGVEHMGCTISRSVHDGSYYVFRQVGADTTADAFFTWNPTTHPQYEGMYRVCACQR